MPRSRRFFLLLLLVLALGAPGFWVGSPGAAASQALSGQAPLPQSRYPADPQPAEWERLAGANRYGTAVKISMRSFPGGATSVYLARGDVFADALAAGVITDGPVLLVPSCRDVPAAVLTEIRRLSPQRVTALGGEAAVCTATLRQAAQGRPASRLAGANRYETAAQVSQHEFSPGEAEVVYLASAADSPDAVVGGVLTDGPILLVPRTGTGVPPAVKAEISRLDPSSVIALGGPAAVPEAMLLDAAAGRPTERLAGANRYDTSVAIAVHQFPAPTTVYLAQGGVFADAVASGSLTDGPVLLLPPNCGSFNTANSRYLSTRARGATVVALGGEAAICQAQLEGAASLTPRPDLRIVTTELAEATVGEPYFMDLWATGGLPPYEWMSTGELPRGLEFRSDGSIHGTPERAGVYEVYVDVMDSLQSFDWGVHLLPLVVRPNWDGAVEPAVSIAASAGMSCAVGSSGVVRCWGEGELGDASNYAIVPVYVPGIQASEVTAGAATCVQNLAQGAQCWGNNYYGAVGNGESLNTVPRPVDVVGLGATRDVQAGITHTCAVSSEGAASCWGANFSGSLGDGTFVDSSVPVEVLGLQTGVQAISAGASHTCAVLTGGALKCWGHNWQGQLGNGTRGDPVPTPTDVVGLSGGVQQVSTGNGYTCAVIDDGSVQCWGWNDGGRLGTGDTTLRTSPTTVSGLTGPAVSVKTGWSHTCAVLESGAVQCWGENSFGQLGDGQAGSGLVSTTPVSVQGLDGVAVEVALGQWHTCALLSEGRVQCWGYAARGQLGDGRGGMPDAPNGGEFSTEPVTVLGFGPDG